MPQLASRKRRVIDNDDEDDRVSSPEPTTQRRRRATPEDDVYGNDPSATQGDISDDQMVKKMVRLALACEYHRRSIRRSDLTDKVLGSEGRKYKQIFNQAQVQLRNVFGMEMVELPAREKLTMQQRRGASCCPAVLFPH